MVSPIASIAADHLVGESIEVGDVVGLQAKPGVLDEDDSELRGERVV